MAYVDHRDPPRLLGHGMVIIAEHARDLPGTVLVLPEVDEPPLADRLRVFRLRVVEAMDTHLDRAVAIHGIHLQRPGNELSAHFAADVRLYALGQALPAQGHPTLVVVELHVVGDER